MAVQVKTKYGKIEGIFENGIYKFFGIPYAAPPVGDLRFRPPVCPEPWEGVRNASKFGPTVPQSKLDGLLGDLFTATYPSGDDCLNLNVWTPDPEAKGLPVYVWIHGGSFSMGAGSDPLYDGSAFARDGIVTVTINYRLGSQGFLYIEGAEGTGNFGMLDQIAALEWVQENIAAFGGDPHAVTIGGQSAGGMSVSTLLGMPKAKGLFKRAITESGAAHAGLNIESAGGVAGYLCEKLGIEQNDIEALRNVPIKQLIEAEADTCMRSFTRQEPRFKDLNTAGIPMAFEPVYGTESLPDRPIDAIRKGSAAGVDLLAGFTAEEDLALMKASPELFGTAEGEDIPPVVVDMTAQMIFGNTQVDPAKAVELYRRNRPEAMNLELMCELTGDWNCRMPTIRMAEAQLNYTSSVYTYMLNWTSNNEKWGRGHCLELPLVFDTCDSKVGSYLAGENVPRKIIDTLHGAWVQFIKTGKPGFSTLPEWPAYTLEKRSVMYLDMESNVVDDPRPDERAIWEKVV